MSEHSNIEWTDASWNPITGCTVVSPGCVNCYAMRMAATRLKDEPKYAGVARMGKGGPQWTGLVQFHDDELERPSHWRKPKMVFVNSMSDTFHPDVQVTWLREIFAVIAGNPRHTFQVLTKRPERMLELSRQRFFAEHFTLPNVWLGTSVEDQGRAGKRIPILLKVPCAVRFLSVEPLLESVDLEVLGCDRPVARALLANSGNSMLRGINWVICGGESGPSARPMNPDWARSIRDQCKRAGVPFFMKQMSRKQPIPDDLMIREWPRKNHDA